MPNLVRNFPNEISIQILLQMTLVYPNQAIVYDDFAVCNSHEPMRIGPGRLMAKMINS